MNMKKIIAVAAPLVCVSAYMAYAQMEPPPGQMMPPPQGMVAAPPQGYAPQAPVAVAQPFCQPYTDSFTMGGEKRITHGTACLHPDGSWELHPTQASMRYVAREGAMYIVPAQPFATVVVTDHHHHYHNY